MQKTATVDWNLFKNNVLWDAKSLYMPWLYKPLSVRWPQEAEDFSHALDAISEVLPRDLRTFFHIHIIASTLLDANAARKNAVALWLGNNSAEEPLMPLPLQAASQGVWRTVPVISVHGRTPRLTHFLIGAIPTTGTTDILPHWASGFFDQKAHAAIADALSSARDETGCTDSLFAFPLAPMPGTCKEADSRMELLIHDRSLGLPLALGALAAIYRAPQTGNWLATGDVKNRENIAPVSYLEEKITIFSESAGDYNLFIYPQDNPETIFRQPSDNTVEARKVGTLRQAWLWAARYEPGNYRETLRLETALQDAQAFAANCIGLKPDSLIWCRATGQLPNVLESVKRDPSLLEKLVGCLAESLKTAASGYSHAREISQFISIEDIAEIGETSPALAYEWCHLNVVLAKHLGDNRMAKLWRTQGIRYEGFISSNAELRKTYASSIIHHFGSGLHVEYIFQPKFPEAFQTILRQEQKRSRGYDCDYVMGSLYGAMAQNFAFCGSKYLRKVKEYVRKSQEKFGSGRNPDLRGDWLRSFGYLFGAFMDSRKFSEAKESLRDFMAATSWEQFQTNCEAPGFSRHHKAHALYFLARYLADTKIQSGPLNNNELEPMGQWIKGNFARCTQCDNDHPWQLFYYNIGRLFLAEREPAMAQVAWEQSIVLCENGQEAINVMALLPLASLQKAQMFTLEHQIKTLSILELIAHSSSLHKNHFHDLLITPSWQAALDKVAEYPEQFFPFNYH